MLLNLETKRLILRPFSASDALDMYNNWSSDDSVTSFLTWNSHQSVNDAVNILNLWVEQYQKPERINCAIVLKSDKTLIGGIDVVGYLDGIPVIGYVISRKYWNNGYATEACSSLLEYLFSLGHKKVRIDAVVDNIGSNKVIRKCKGKLIDTVDEYIESKQKTFKINIYEVYKEDYVLK